MNKYLTEFVIRFCFIVKKLLKIDKIPTLKKNGEKLKFDQYTL